MCRKHSAINGIWYISGISKMLLNSVTGLYMYMSFTDSGFLNFKSRNYFNSTKYEYVCYTIVCSYQKDIEKSFYHMWSQCHLAQLCGFQCHMICNIQITPIHRNVLLTCNTMLNFHKFHISDSFLKKIQNLYEWKKFCFVLKWKKTK